MKKICFISNLFPSQQDPTFGSFVGLNYQQLQAMGFEVAPPISMNARLSPGKKLLAYISFFAAGVRALFSNKYDLFYFHYLTYSTICLWLVLPFKKVTYLVNIHGDDLVGTRLIHKVMGCRSGYILKHASAVVVPSAYFKDQLLLRHPNVPESKIIVSESAGLNEQVFYPKPEHCHSTRRHFGYVSRLDEGKGWELMLEAFSRLKAEHPRRYADSELSVYGTGAQVAAFTAQVKALGLEDVVTYYGPLPQPELGQAYRSFDFFLFPTRRESFGLVAVEAMACGTPVIASQIRPLTDIIRDGENGQLFEDGSVEGLYHSLLEAFDVSGEAYVSLSTAAIAAVEDIKASRVQARLYQDLCRVLG